MGVCIIPDSAAGEEAATVTTEDPPGGHGGHGGGAMSYMQDHVFVPVLMGVGGLMFLVLLGAMCTLPYRYLAARRGLP